MRDPEDAWDPVRKTFKPGRLSDIRSTEFSSWGPTDDGRIKPDVVANGDAVIATAIPKRCLPDKCRLTDVAADGHDYVQKSGTSMAAPVVTGIVALLNELSLRERGMMLRADEAKALLVHTAISEHNRPTYEIGWGSVQADDAGILLREEIPGDHLLMHDVHSGKVNSIQLQRITERPGRVTLAWIDPPGETTDVLVNNVDAELVPPTGRREDAILPWTLDPAQPSAPAKRGRNQYDNLERLDVPSSSDAPGNWTLRIEGDDWPDAEVQQVAVALWGFEVAEN